jgi:hypothetical protein
MEHTFLREGDGNQAGQDVPHFYLTVQYRIHNGPSLLPNLDLVTSFLR